MSSFDYSVVLIVPAALREKGNLLACALGHDTLPGSTFAAPLSATGEAPATHFGCHTWAQESFVQMFGAAAQGSLPEIAWSDFGLTVEYVQELITAMVFSAQPGADPSSHYTATAATQGLQRVRDSEE